jgi:hypothetical protein
VTFRHGFRSKKISTRQGTVLLLVLANVSLYIYTMPINKARI